MKSVLTISRVVGAVEVDVEVEVVVVVRTAFGAKSIKREFPATKFAGYGAAEYVIPL